MTPSDVQNLSLTLDKENYIAVSLAFFLLFFEKPTTEIHNISLEGLRFSSLS